VTVTAVAAGTRSRARSVSFRVLAGDR
jgi:Family of unknown function (DUF6529)